MLGIALVFFCSCRRRHTRFSRDWSSDVCSSDLGMDDGRTQEEYVRQVLEAYRKTPGTLGSIRRPDRVLAAQLCQRGISVSLIENAFVLAAARSEERRVGNKSSTTGSS